MCQISVWFGTSDLRGNDEEGGRGASGGGSGGGGCRLRGSTLHRRHPRDESRVQRRIGGRDAVDVHQSSDVSGRTLCRLEGRAHWIHPQTIHVQSNHHLQLGIQVGIQKSRQKITSSLFANNLDFMELAVAEKTPP